MQRGIISLTKKQSNLAINFAKKSTQDLSSLILKLNLAINSKDEISIIEVNREEIESLLDSFPVPTQEDTKDLPNIRNIFFQFLSQGN